MDSYNGLVNMSDGRWNLSEQRKMENCSGFLYSSIILDLSVNLALSVNITTLFLALVCGVVWWKSHESRRSRDLLSHIPGPPSVPVLGSILSVGTRPHAAFMQLWRRHGDIFRIQIGSVPIVVLNGLDVIREATVSQGDVFSGRPELYTFKLASEGKSMAFNSDSAEWRIHHRLAAQSLRLVAREGHFFTRVVSEEARALADVMIEAGGAPYNPAADITWSVAHVMYTLCYGDSHLADDFSCMIKSTLRLIQCHKLGNAVNFFPWAKYLLRTQYEELRQVCGRMIRTTKCKEKEHLECYQEGQVRDALDALIRLGIRRPCPLQQDQILHTVQEFIGAGMDIIYLSLTWSVLFCVRHPEFRDRMVAEIDAIIGQREPTEHDLGTLPYTNAFVLETLRYSCVVPMALPHSTTADTELGGHQIPAGTMVLINLCSIQRDPTLWGDPDVFRPSRFIDPVTAQLSRSALERHGAFGFGRRRCIGEHLGRKQLVMYLVILLQRCHLWEEPSEASQEEITCDSGIVLQPKPFHIRVTGRC